MTAKKRTSYTGVAKLSAVVATAKAEGQLPTTLGEIKRFVKPKMDGVPFNDNTIRIVLDQFGIKVRGKGRPAGQSQKTPKSARYLAKVLRQVISNIEVSIGCQEGELLRNGVHEDLVRLIGGHLEKPQPSNTDIEIDEQSEVRQKNMEIARTVMKAVHPNLEPVGNNRQYSPTNGVAR